jgi:hypothetical protein
MPNNIVNEDELKLLLAESNEKQVDSSLVVKQQKLSMKFLYQQIRELEEQHLILFDRLQAMDQQIQGFMAFQTEAVADKEIAHQADSLTDSCIPRAVRHPAPNKKSIWSSLFGSSSSNSR